MELSGPKRVCVCTHVACTKATADCRLILQSDGFRGGPAHMVGPDVLCPIPFVFNHRVHQE